ncbi:hypothetical protein EBE87_23055 [Pseudoroseomonas wenyumeiae]|uniref:Uncharacterized protein n=1 Tax=Teichococcus wenyumeiae TaxID=2478470 RepID=A0A3A9JLK2_9PROT|nr:hypothetical protein D6Z83_08255 [Pseudoroseomonas wenyumeiae]RMI17311.1 hypothetical protein EBE87_23055 [Pseudoroseomonas wenyumeiae]
MLGLGWRNAGHGRGWFCRSRGRRATAPGLGWWGSQFSLEQIERPRQQLRVALPSAPTELLQPHQHDPINV